MLQLEKEILTITKASAITGSEVVQSLWSGYGEIRRYFLKGGEQPSLIVKHINLPEGSNHPHGWNTEVSHQRKLKSYQVEKNWYAAFAHQTNQACRVPQAYHVLEEKKNQLLIMEDLDASGYSKRLDPQSVKLSNAKDCLSWLAHFHAKFIGVPPDGLWPVGTYWHLDTRPDEWEKMKDAALRQAARSIDQRLGKARFQTLVHGDAKLANFCFGRGGEVAAVDFQYVGKGCGMKDVAYFISSCFDDPDCQRYEKELLNHYFHQLEIALDNQFDFQEVKNEWASLYPYAWADFYRFLDGWKPGHWKMHGYSKRLTQQVLNDLLK